jgi:hypothetical protein
MASDAVMASALLASGKALRMAAGTAMYEALLPKTMNRKVPPALRFSNSVATKKAIPAPTNGMKIEKVAKKGPSLLMSLMRDAA